MVASGGLIGGVEGCEVFDVGGDQSPAPGRRCGEDLLVGQPEKCLVGDHCGNIMAAPTQALGDDGGKHLVQQ